jgi:hypothetical protein
LESFNCYNFKKIFNVVLLFKKYSKILIFKKLLVNIVLANHNKDDSVVLSHTPRCFRGFFLFQFKKLKANGLNILKIFAF